MTTLQIAGIIAMAAGILLAAIAAAIAELHPVAVVREYWRTQTAADQSQNWAPLELTGPRHALGVAPGTDAQRMRWTQNTETFDRVEVTA